MRKAPEPVGSTALNSGQVTRVMETCVAWLDVKKVLKGETMGQEALKGHRKLQCFMLLWLWPSEGCFQVLL